MKMEMDEIAAERCRSAVSGLNLRRVVEEVNTSAAKNSPFVSDTLYIWRGVW